MGSSSARCWSLDTYNPVKGIAPKSAPVPADTDYATGFGTELMIKDLKIAMQTAQELIDGQRNGNAGNNTGRQCDSEGTLDSEKLRNENDGLRDVLPMATRALELYELMGEMNKSSSEDIMKKDFGSIYKYVYKGQPAKRDE